VDIAVDPELNLALVVNALGNRVSVIDLDTYEVNGQVSVGKIPVAISINPETHLAAVVKLLDKSLTVINLQNWRTTHIPVGKYAIDVAINPLDNRALVIGDKGHELFLIDLNTNKIIDQFEIQKPSLNVAVNPFTNIAAIVDDKKDSVTLIQLPNPIPEITAINPSTVLRGSKVTRILIEGSGFIKTSTVSVIHPTPYFLHTDFIDNHYLEATIPEGLFTKAWTYPLVVTNPPPEGGASNPVSLQVVNPIPSITALDPADAMAGTKGLTLNVYGTGFFDDTTVSINGITRAFTLIDKTKLQIQLTAEDLEVGKYLAISAFNALPEGGQSNSLKFTVQNPVPSLSSTTPSSIIAGSPDFTLTLNGDNFVKTSIVNFNNQQVSSSYISKNQIQATISSDAIKTPGSYPVKVINPIPGGGETSPTAFTVKPRLEIQITSPSDGETINRAKILVKGIIQSDTKDVGITVNGILAEISGNNWVANNIPLTIGSSTITAVATDYNENTATKIITVYTDDITQFVELSANVTGGIAPLQVHFSVSTANFTPVAYQMDFDGDGIADYTGTTFNNISYTYTSEGTFYTKITVSDDQGNTYSEIDTLLRAKWEGMKGALGQGNINDSLNYFANDSKEEYGEIFQVFAPQLPSLVSGMREITLIEIIGNTAEYYIKRFQRGTDISYFIYFIRDENGIWRISSF
jgi:hypothetical protein